MTWEGKMPAPSSESTRQLLCFLSGCVASLHKCGRVRWAGCLALALVGLSHPLSKTHKGKFQFPSPVVSSDKYV